jgi:hypothetical protein
MSLGDTNLNPGNLKYGKFAKSMGAVGKDKQGHAIFPNYWYGRRALETLLLQRAHGVSLRQLNVWYAEDQNWSANVATAMKVKDRDHVLNLLEPRQLELLVRAVHTAEGTRYRLSWSL